ncbi:MAG: sulfurtransferase [Chitinophagaceae bacterium]
MSILSLFGIGNSKIKQALLKGAVIIDVRTAHEFDQGKVPGSINIPVDRISSSIEQIRKMHKPVIICCATGARSDKAVCILKASGIKEVYNGGSWETVMKMVNKI